MKQDKLEFHTYNKQFESLYRSKDLSACFELFKSTPYLTRPFDYYMLETLNFNFESYTDLEQEGLLNNYIKSLESELTNHNRMIMDSLVEDLLSNEKIREKVWGKLISAELKDPMLIKELFHTLDIQENPDLCFTLFRKYPSYSLLHDLGMNYAGKFREYELSDQEKDAIWDNYVSILNSNDKASKDPILYSLWVDFFEDHETQEEVWNKLMSRKLNNEAIKGILEHSGPVGFERKKMLIDKHITNLEMHPSILMCLFGSLHDVFGDISFADGRSILKELKINPSNEHYSYLKEKLFKFNSKEEYWSERNKKDDSKT